MQKTTPHVEKSSKKLRTHRQKKFPRIDSDYLRKKVMTSQAIVIGRKLEQIVEEEVTLDDDEDWTWEQRQIAKGERALDQIYRDRYHYMVGALRRHFGQRRSSFPHPLRWPGPPSWYRDVFFHCQYCRNT